MLVTVENGVATGIRGDPDMPFTAGTLRFPQISDESPDQVVLTGAPARPSAYTLLVLTVEPDRGTVAKTQYYTGTVSNLVKLRRDGGWVRAGGGH